MDELLTKLKTKYPDLTLSRVHLWLARQNSQKLNMKNYNEDDYEDNEKVKKQSKKLNDKKRSPIK